MDSARNCLVQTLELEIEETESNEDRKNLLEKYSSSLQRIDPSLKLRSDLSEKSDDDFRELRQEKQNYYTQKNELIPKINTAIDNLAYGDFVKYTEELYNLVKEINFIDTEGDFHFSKDKKDGVVNEFKDVFFARKKALEKKLKKNDIKILEWNADEIGKLNEFLLKFNWLSPKMNQRIVKSKLGESIDNYLDKVKAMNTPEAKYPINDSDYITDIFWHCKKLGSLGVLKSKKCPSVLFPASEHVEPYREAARSCLVEHLEILINGIKAVSDRVAKATEWSNFLKLIDPTLKFSTDFRSAVKPPQPPKPDTIPHENIFTPLPSSRTEPGATEAKSEELALLKEPSSLHRDDESGTIPRENIFSTLPSSGTEPGATEAKYIPPQAPSPLIHSPPLSRDELLALLIAEPKSDLTVITNILKGLPDFRNYKLEGDVIDFFLSTEFDSFLSSPENLKNFLFKYAARCGGKFELLLPEPDKVLDKNYYHLLKKSFYEMVIYPENSNPFLYYFSVAKQLKEKPSTTWKEHFGELKQIDPFFILFWLSINVGGENPNPKEIREKYCQMISGKQWNRPIHSIALKNLVNFINWNGAWIRIADFPGIREFYMSFINLQNSLFPPSLSFKTDFVIDPLYSFDDFVNCMRHITKKKCNFDELSNFFKSYRKGVSKMSNPEQSLMSQQMLEALEGSDIKKLDEIFSDEVSREKMKEEERPDLSFFDITLKAKTERITSDQDVEGKEVSKPIKFREFFRGKEKCANPEYPPFNLESLETVPFENPYESLRKTFDDIVENPNNIALYQKFALLLTEFIKEENRPKDWKVAPEPFHILLFASIGSTIIEPNITLYPKPYEYIRVAYCNLPQNMEGAEDTFKSAYSNSVSFFRTYNERKGNGIQTFADKLYSSVTTEYRVSSLFFSFFDFANNKYRRGLGL